MIFGNHGYQDPQYISRSEMEREFAHYRAMGDEVTITASDTGSGIALARLSPVGGLAEATADYVLHPGLFEITEYTPATPYKVRIGAGVFSDGYSDFDIATDTLVMPGSGLVCIRLWADSALEYEYFHSPTFPDPVAQVGGFWTSQKTIGNVSFVDDVLISIHQIQRLELRVHRDL